MRGRNEGDEWWRIRARKEWTGKDDGVRQGGEKSDR